MQRVFDLITQARAQPHDDSRAGGERDRKGTGSQGHPRELGPERPPLRDGEFWKPPARPSRIEPFWACERGVYRCGGSEKGGLFEIADKGTIFLDEIGSCSAGDSDEVAPGDPGARVHAAWAESIPSRSTCGSSWRRMSICIRWSRKGYFGRILYYRLHVITIELPPLRDRR